MQHSCTVLWLSEIDEVLHPKVHHLLYVRRILLVDGLQQAIDLTHLQAALCFSATHPRIRKTLLRKEDTSLHTSHNMMSRLGFVLHFNK